MNESLRFPTNLACFPFQGWASWARASSILVLRAQIEDFLMTKGASEGKSTERNPRTLGSFHPGACTCQLATTFGYGTEVEGDFVHRGIASSPWSTSIVMLLIPTYIFTEYNQHLSGTGGEETRRHKKNAETAMSTSRAPGSSGEALTPSFEKPFGKGPCQGIVDIIRYHKAKKNSFSRKRKNRNRINAIRCSTRGITFWNRHD